MQTCYWGLNLPSEYIGDGDNRVGFFKSYTHGKMIEEMPKLMGEGRVPISLLD